MQEETQKNIPLGHSRTGEANKTSVPRIQTYAEDMAQAIGDNQEGMVQKIIHQDEENEAEKAKQSLNSTKNKFFVLMGGVLILATMGLIVFSVMKNTVGTMPAEKQFTPLIFNDNTVFVEVAELKKDQILEAVYEVVNDTPLKAGEVLGIYLTENKQIIGLKRFIELMQGTFVIPQGIAGEGALVSEDFLLGIAGYENVIPDVATTFNQDFFILIKVRSMTDVFNNIKTWENKMFSELYKFFIPNLSSATEYLLTKDFKDGIVENKPARILYGQGVEDTKNIIMMYVFGNDTSIVITKSPLTAREVLRRLASSQIKK